MTDQMDEAAQHCRPHLWAPLASLQNVMGQTDGALAGCKVQAD